MLPHRVDILDIMQIVSTSKPRIAQVLHSFFSACEFYPKLQVSKDLVPRLLLCRMRDMVIPTLPQALEAADNPPVPYDSEKSIVRITEAIAAAPPGLLQRLHVFLGLPNGDEPPTSASLELPTGDSIPQSPPSLSHAMVLASMLSPVLYPSSSGIASSIGDTVPSLISSPTLAALPPPSATALGKRREYADNLRDGSSPGVGPSPTTEASGAARWTMGSSSRTGGPSRLYFAPLDSEQDRASIVEDSLNAWSRSLGELSPGTMSSALPGRLCSQPTSDQIPAPILPVGLGPGSRPTRPLNIGL